MSNLCHAYYYEWVELLELVCVSVFVCCVIHLCGGTAAALDSRLSKRTSVSCVFARHKTPLL